MAADDVEVLLRGPTAYRLATKALEAMETNTVWPTALNFEIWTHYLGSPESPLAQEMERLLQIGEPFTDTLAEELAAAFLPKQRLNDQIRDAGDALSKELDSVARAIQSAQKSSESYSSTLAHASKSLGDGENDANSFKSMVETLASATRRVQRENKSLEKRLAESTSEVDRLREHLEQVRRDATTDGLTNLANRKAFDDELDRACADADAQGIPLTLAVIDIDHFKNFNDTWGHQTGDQVIRFVASVIGRVGAPPRFAARYGGEEFALIFPRETADMAHAVLEEIREEISSRMLKRRSTNEDLGTITVSAGFAERARGESPHSVMERADEALYASKRGGRNMVSSSDRKAA